mgnify:CR=1 FL=1
MGKSRAIFNVFPNRADIMAATYNILTGNSQVKGRIGEVIASHYLRKQGFIVNRPSRILKLLGRAGVPNNYEVQFLRHYKKTMDYFAVYPRDDPLLIRREAVLFPSSAQYRFEAPQLYLPKNLPSFLYPTKNFFDNLVL